MVQRIEELTIAHVDSRGLGRGAWTNGAGDVKTVVVPGALAGDVVDVRIRRRKGGALHGEVERVIASKHSRIEPFCSHFTDCGGCTLQDLAYEDQLSLKSAMVQQAFDEVFRRTVQLPPIATIIPAPREQRYRNKLEFSFGAHRWLQEEEIARLDQVGDRRGLGFHVAGRFDRVLDLTECYLQDDPSEEIRAFMRQWSASEGLSYYHPREHHGLLRLLIIRTSTTGETMVTIMFGEDDEAGIARVMSAVGERFPDVMELNYVINTSRNDSIFPHEVQLCRGNGYITEHCGAVKLRIRPKAFFQTNPEQAVHLYARALDLAHLNPTDRVYDLYSGIGSIALTLAPAVQEVVGIESIADAVVAARENAMLNGCKNAQFEEGLVEHVLPDVMERRGSADVIVVDPPRAGLHKNARRLLLSLDAPPRTLVYISCNPRTQATDLQELQELYAIDQLQPVDMFPQTRHVENIAILHRRDS
jgi:23S rRNA (uracil1939-C5)-methyltransferase